MTNTPKTIWYALEITAEYQAADAIEHALNELRSLGTEIDHLRRKEKDAVTVVGYFNTLPEDEILWDELHYALRIYDLNEDSIQSVIRREIENQDWLQEWKKHWKPTRIGGFVITPPWEESVGGDGIIIRIEPNMAFGTGTHETTQLCLTAIETHYVPGQTFLDVGTGTGILAIAAAKLSNAETDHTTSIAGPSNKLSALKIIACDTDVDSVTIAKENAELNGVASQISFRIGSISELTPAFDFVCANLTIDVILPILPLLLEKAAGTLVLSGILVEQEGAIVASLTGAGVKSFTIDRAGEWIAVIIENEKERTEN